MAYPQTVAGRGMVFLANDLVDPINNGQIIRAFPNVHAGSQNARVLLFMNARQTGATIPVLRWRLAHSSAQDV
ncbi:hypothetical protein [Cutibacterium sp. V947]